MKQQHAPYREGLRDGIPIALGYLAVSFSLGIAAKAAGLSAFQGFFASLLNNASAGEYAGFVLIREGASYLEMALITLITNARYLLMSFSLAQRISPKTGLIHRLCMGFAVTDEIFGISIARPGHTSPFYHYGAMTLALPAWSVGTALGILAGNLLPGRAVSALSVALYGMFLAVIVPPAKKDRVVRALVLSGFLFSALFAYLPYLSALSSGLRTILLTVALSALGAAFFPIKIVEREEENG